MNRSRIGSAKKRTQYPVCSRCDHTLNPNLEDDCEKYYMVGGEIYCKYCFEDYARDWLDENMDEFAELIGIQKVGIEG